jgi:tRNA-dihydrouridine synthase B
MIQIGNLKLENRFIMAPMAGITNMPFRVIVRGMGAGLVFSEMVSAMGLTMKAKKTLQYLKSVPAEKPIGVQIFGSEPDIMARAAEMVVDSGADIVDLNMGCPVKKIVKTGAGASLLKDPEKVRRIVSSVRKICKIPLTVKIRAGWSPEKAIACEIARVIEDCGADAVIIHPRFANQGYSGKAAWSLIGKVKEKMKIPVIGNGDINYPSDALNMMRLTGCDGVMIGRAAAGKPWIFRQILQLEKGLPVQEPDMSERRSIIMQHYNLLKDSMNEHRAALCMRGLLIHYTKGLPDSGRLREGLNKIKDLESLVSAMDSYFTGLGSKIH